MARNLHLLKAWRQQMQKIKINQLAVLFQEKKITEKKARNIIWEEVFKNPKKYELFNLSEDQLSDFLLFTSGNFITYLKKYRRKEVPFECFLRKCIKNSLKNWFRRQQLYMSSEKCLADQNMLDFEYRQELLSEEFIREIEKNEETEGSAPLLVKHLSKKKQSILRDFVHICACKACNDLDYGMIQDISGFLKIDMKTLKQQLDSLKLKTEDRAVKREVLIQRRNHAFFFYRRSLYEISTLTPSSYRYELTEQKIKNRTDRWQNMNRLLEHRCIASPTALEIAAATGLSERKVYFYLNHRNKKINLLPFIKKPSGSRGTL